MTNKAKLLLKATAIPDQLRPTFLYIGQLIIDGNGIASHEDVQLCEHYNSIKSLFEVNQNGWTASWFVKQTERAKGFVPPVLSEVTAYMTELGFPSESSKFVDFYQSKGWMVGKNKMKDWKASCRNWVKGKEQPKQQLNERITGKISKSDHEQFAAGFRVK